jgi:hypothetical protein
LRRRLGGQGLGLGLGLGELALQRLDLRGLHRIATGELRDVVLGVVALADDRLTALFIVFTV